MKKGFKALLSLLLCAAVLLASLPAAAFNASADTGPRLCLAIEGANAAMYRGEAAFTAGESIDDILRRVCAEQNIPLTYDTSYGTPYISKIGGEPASSNASWYFYLNDTAAAAGASSVYPNDGDSVVFALSGFDTNWNNLTPYPLVTLSDPSPSPGEAFTVTVKKQVTTYDEYYNPTTTVEPVSGAFLSFGGNTYTTDENGSAKLTAPYAEGRFELAVSRENPDTSAGYPLLVRRSIAVDVSGTVPTSRILTAADENRTVDLGNGATNNLTVTGGGAVTLVTDSGVIPSALSVDFKGSSNRFLVDFPEGTAVSGGAWDGRLTLSIPTAVPSSMPSGAVLDMAAQIGSSTADLALSQYVKITLTGQAGRRAGYIDASGKFHEIPTRLLSDMLPAGFCGSDAFFNNGEDLIIYTKHFSQFIAYTVSSGSDSDLSALIAGASVFLQNQSPNSDWSVFALARAGYAIPSSYLSGAAEKLSENGGNFTSPTTLARTILALRAAGANPQDFNGCNLVEKLCNFPGLTKSGLNGPVYALIAIGSYLPGGSNSLWDESSLIAYILSQQNPDGGFSLSPGSASDADMTAATLTALSSHLDEAGVIDAVNRALGYLSETQTAGGGFIPFGSTAEASESASQVVIALCSLGLDPKSDSRFVKNGNSPLDALLSCRNADGGFRHTQAAGKSDITATQQALMALTAYARYENGEPALFDLAGIIDTITSAVPTAASPQTGDEGGPQAAASAGCAAILAICLLYRGRTAKQIRKNKPSRCGK